MKGTTIAVVVAAAAAFAGANPLDRNLAYRSPYLDKPDLGHDTRFIHARIARRQIVNATEFSDEHYPTWYGADFSNSPYIYSGGVNFTHGVASGDPLDTSVLLWTRAGPKGAGPDVSVPICIRYGIWDNSKLTGDPVDSGEAFTSWDVDFTVKVEAKNLKADTKYWYQFSDCTNKQTVSIIGATRTVASPDTPADQVNGGKPLSFAVFSCANWPYGYFNAYAVATQNTTADIFVHLGDYIYEYKNGDYGNGTSIGRAAPATELATLVEYRSRIAQYRSDPALAAAHQNFPWIIVWDDHDVADNTWKAGSSDSNDTATGCQYNPAGVCFTDRKLNAVRAFHEWMPVRQVVSDDLLRIWRNFQIGKLLDLTMLDTRQYDRDITDLYFNTDVGNISSYENRSIMGAAQEKWLFDTLQQSVERGAVWRVIGQQVVFEPLTLGPVSYVTLDGWDGYKANRLRVLDHIRDGKVNNAIILSGDSHANWVSDLAYPNDTTGYNSLTGNGAFGVEFAVTAVTSPGPFGADAKQGFADAISQVILGMNSDLQWSEAAYRGFFTLELNSTDSIATYYSVRNISHPTLDSFVNAVFHVKAGENKLARPVANNRTISGALRRPASHA